MISYYFVNLDIYVDTVIEYVVTFYTEKVDTGVLKPNDWNNYHIAVNVYYKFTKFYILCLYAPMELHHEWNYINTQ